MGREVKNPPRHAWLGSAAKQLEAGLVAPVKAMRLNYLPLLMIYFAYGALGLVAIAETFWIKQALKMTPAEIAALTVWLTLPWTIKMVFGQLVDSVPILGSQRRIYVFCGAVLVAMGLLILAGAAGGWLDFAGLDTLYVIAKLVIVIGIVLQDVVADAMSTEVVQRTHADGSPRAREDVNRELGMVQVLARLALSFGIFVVSGVSGWLAGILPYETIFLLGLVIPVVSITGALLVRLEDVAAKPIDWRILGGGLAFGTVVAVVGLLDVPFAQEIIFVLSMAVIIYMLMDVVEELDADIKRKIFFAAIVIFVFRATPSVGEGYRWFSIDTLGFDEAFFGTLAQIGAGLALIGTWLLSDAITRRPVAQVLLWLTVLITILSIPNLLLVFGVYEWTEAVLGIGARGIAILDTAAESPFAYLSAIPMLTLVAIYAPAGRRATWFALMASMMNLALVAGQLQTKYLNILFPVGRGDYGALPVLMVIVVVVGFALPFAAILAFGKRAT